MSRGFLVSTPYHWIARLLPSRLGSGIKRACPVQYEEPCFSFGRKSHPNLFDPWKKWQGHLECNSRDEGHICYDCVVTNDI